MELITKVSNKESLNEVMMRLVHAEKLNGSLSFKLKQQLSLTYLLIVVKDGNGTILIDNQEYKMRKDTFYFCCPEQTFGVVVENEELELYLFRFNVFQPSKQDTTMNLLSDKNLFINHGIIHFKNNVSFQCEEIISHWLSKEYLHTYRCQMAFQELLYCIIKQEAEQGESSFEAMERTKEYMDRHYYEKLPIEDLARMANLSPNYFVELFKKIYGKSVVEYLTNLRINAAKLLIARGGLKLKQISKQIGYDDEFYFSRKFKQEVGMAPTIYRRKRSQKIAVYDRQLVGQVLALRIIPYAAPIHPKWTEYYFQNYGKDIPIHLNAYRHHVNWKSNIEMLAKSNPDIVMVSDLLSVCEEKELQAKSLNLLKVPSTLPWREQFTWIADRLEVSEEAVQWLRTYEWKAKHARSRLKRKHGQLQSLKIATLRIYKQRIYLHANRGIESTISEGLQLAPPIRPSLNTSEEVSLQQLKLLRPDCLLLLICQESETLAFWHELQHTSEWSEMGAVQKNRVGYLPSDPWLEYSAYAQSRIIDQVKLLFL